MNFKILVAEDDPHILEGVCDLLQREGYTVLPAGDGLSALDLWKTEHPDFLLLDIMMPGRSGYDVCREVRRTDTEIPILFLSAKSEEVDRVVGLELGADDFLPKPFGKRELLARIAAIARRTLHRSPVASVHDPRAPFHMGDLEIQPDELRARRGTQVLDLGPRDVAILRLLHERRGKVVDRNELFEKCWGADFPGSTRSVDQHISQLRRKIETDPERPALIRTVHGAGYRWE